MKTTISTLAVAALCGFLAPAEACPPSYSFAYCAAPQPVYAVAAVQAVAVQQVALQPVYSTATVVEQGPPAFQPPVAEQLPAMPQPVFSQPVCPQVQPVYAAASRTVVVAAAPAYQPAYAQAAVAVRQVYAAPVYAQPVVAASALVVQKQAVVVQKQVVAQRSFVDYPVATPFAQASAFSGAQAQGGGGGRRGGGGVSAALTTPRGATVAATGNRAINARTGPFGGTTLRVR